MHVTYIIKIVMSVRPSAWNNSAPTGRILMTFYISGLSLKICRNNSSSNLTGMTGTLHEKLCIFISCWILFRMRNVSGKSCMESQNTYSTPNYLLFRKSCRLWDNGKNIVQSDRPQVTIWNDAQNMRIALGITKAKDTHSEFVTRFVFPWQQRLRERASMLRLYLHCCSC